MKALSKTYLFLILLVIFFASAIVNYLLWVHFEHSMGAENAVTVRKEIIQVHCVLMGLLVGGLFAKPSMGEVVKMPLVVTALGISVVWVLFISSTWIGYPGIGADGPDGLINQFSDRATELSALVSGTLAYLCNKGKVSSEAIPNQSGE
jgi:hypothetical protein